MPGAAKGRARGGHRLQFLDAPNPQRRVTDTGGARLQKTRGSNNDVATSQRRTQHPTSGAEVGSAYS